MAEEQSAQEKTEQPTPKRRQDARDKGEVARSRELNTVLSLIAAGLGLAWFGAQLGRDMQSALVGGLTVIDSELAEPEAIIEVARIALVDSTLALTPFLAVMILSPFIGPMLRYLRAR